MYTLDHNFWDTSLFMKLPYKIDSIVFLFISNFRNSNLRFIHFCLWLYLEASKHHQMWSMQIQVSLKMHFSLWLQMITIILNRDLHKHWVNYFVWRRGKSWELFPFHRFYSYVSVKNKPLQAAQLFHFCWKPIFTKKI